MTSNTAETVLITGAGRGLGKALAALYAAKGWRVLCALRDPTHHDGPGEALLLDVADPASIAALGQSLESVPIDLVINNAGIRGDIGGLSTLEPQDFSEVMTVNALAPLLIARALHGNLLAGKRRILANISSRAGSLAEGIVDDDDGDYAYRCSKAALNMATVLLARDFRRDDIAVLSLHPGWVRTEMGGDEAVVTVEDSAAGIKRILDGASLADSGSFHAYDGQRVAW